MVSSIQSFLLFLLLSFTSAVLAQSDPNLVGTWSSKSRKVVTGPGFYNPVTDRFIEPELTGISYSFTSDGYYEEAFYRAIPNPQTPACTSGLMQWQHGTYTLPGNGSIFLQPFGVDGRQLMSSPCSYSEGVYTRYEQAEFIKSYETLLDPYHNVQRLNLFKFDGSPQVPLFLVYNPPEMLPTQTLNPTSTSSVLGPTSTVTAKAKRDMADDTEGGIQQPNDFFNADRLWWVGVGLTAVGTMMYMLPTSR